MPEHVEPAPDPSGAARPQDLAPFITIVGAALAEMGLREPSDTLLLPTARALHSLAPRTSAIHARPE